jgi:hypothetical protein
MIFLEKGNLYLGHRIFDNNGNVIEQTEPKFESDDSGTCVIVGVLDSKTKKQVGKADIFGDFNATGYLKKVLELLAPERTIDIPNFKRIFAAAFNDDVNLCDYCNEFQCNNCIVSKWKEECQR